MNNVGLLFKTMFERGDGLVEKPKLKMELNLEVHPMLGVRLIGWRLDTL